MKKKNLSNYEKDVSIHSSNHCHGVKRYFPASVCSNRYPFYDDSLFSPFYSPKLIIWQNLTQSEMLQNISLSSYSPLV